MTGRTADGRIETVRIAPDGSPVANYAFDVTPARLVTGLITERGVLAASRDGARRRLFRSAPARQNAHQPVIPAQAGIHSHDRSHVLSILDMRRSPAR